MFLSYSGIGSVDTENVESLVVAGQPGFVRAKLTGSALMVSALSEQMSCVKVKKYTFEGNLYSPSREAYMKSQNMSPLEKLQKVRRFSRLIEIKWMYAVTLFFLKTPFRCQWYSGSAYCRDAYW